jgi:predicted small secreted protein
MEIKMKFAKFIMAGLMFFLVLFLTACNTMHGVGRDLEAGGSALAEAAQR